MQVNTNQITDRRVWAATLISAAGWGLSWFICYVIASYFDPTLPLQGVIGYYLSFGFIGITATLISMRIVQLHLPFTYIIIVYTTWGISAVGLGLLTYSDSWLAANGLLKLLLIHITVFGITISWILVQTVDGLTTQDGFKMGLGWLFGIGFPLIVALFSKDFLYWLFITPLVILITGTVGGRVTFWRIQQVKNERLFLPDDELTSPAALGQLMQSSAQQTTFEVVHDSGKSKAKRKPKPSRWPSLSPDLYLVAGLVVIGVLGLGIFALITPVREVRVEVVVTATPHSLNNIAPSTAVSRTLSPSERATYPATPTPIDSVISPGKSSGYHISARLFDGVYWQYTLQAADGSSQTVDASVVSPEVANARKPSALYMDKVGTMRADLITREKVGDIPVGMPVQLLRIIWYEGKAPVYLITPDITSTQPIVAEANAGQLGYAGSP